MKLEGRGGSKYIPLFSPPAKDATTKPKTKSP